MPGKDRAAGLAKDRMRRESNSGHHERTSVICQRTTSLLVPTNILIVKVIFYSYRSWCGWVFLEFTTVAFVI